MTDRNGELGPDNRSLVRDRALTTGTCAQVMRKMSTYLRISRRQIPLYKGSYTQTNSTLQGILHTNSTLQGIIHTDKFHFTRDLTHKFHFTRDLTHKFHFTGDLTHRQIPLYKGSYTQTINHNNKFFYL